MLRLNLTVQMLHYLTTSNITELANRSRLCVHLFIFSRSSFHVPDCWISKEIVSNKVKLPKPEGHLLSRDAVTVDVTNSMYKSWNRQRNLFQRRETARRRLLEPSAKKCRDHAARKLQLAKTMATTVLQPRAQKKLLQRDAMAIVEEEKPVPAILCKRVEAF